MNQSRSSKRPRSAAELMATLQEDPKYQARVRQREQEQRENSQTYYREAAPLLKDLAAAGFSVSSVGELRQCDAKSYRKALPTLLHWLPRISDRYVKEDIIRTLSVPWAAPDAGFPLVQELRRTEDAGIRWTIANGLEIVADDAIFDDLVQLVHEKRYGKAREMLAVALGNMRDPRVVDVLVGLLDDDDLAGHAAMGLGKLRAPAALQPLEALTGHATSWIRKEAKKALIAIKELK